MTSCCEKCYQEDEAKLVWACFNGSCPCHAPQEASVEEKVGTTREEVEEMLGKIGYKVRGRYPGEHIIDHKGQNTGFRILGDRVEYDVPYDVSLVVAFHFKEAKCAFVEGSEDSIAIGTDECFALFMNHDRGKEKTLLKGK